MTNTNKPRIIIPKIFGGISIDKAYEDVMASKAPVPEPAPVTRNARRVDGMIHVPEAGIYFAKQRKHLEKAWGETHSLLAAENLRMPTPEEFRRVLKYFKDSQDNELQKLYNEITQVREPWRANWLDADFKVVNGVLHMNYNHILQNGNLTPRNSDALDKDTLMENRTPGISLEDWLSNPTSQGLPRKTISSGDLYYWKPLADNNSVARFDASSGGADLYCGRYPDYGDSDLGVFGVADAKP